jgi:hypothetical protein
VIPEKKVDDFKTLLAGVDQAAKFILGPEGNLRVRLVSGD